MLASHARLRGRRTVALLSLVTMCTSGIMLAGLPTAAAPAPVTEQVLPSDLSPGHRSLTLVTGDVVHLDTLADGRTTVRAEAAAPDDGAPGRSMFSIRHDPDGDIHVIPADALPLLAGTLDPDLFNVSLLIREGYGGTDAGPIPLIVGYSGDPVPVPGTTTVMDLPVIGASGVTVDSPHEFGAAVAAITAQNGTGAEDADGPAGTPLAGVDHIWLDGAVSASLDVSVPQIGAPEAWDAGLDGDGVTVAVVDTGIDADHPDLAGRVVGAADFSGTGSTGDGNGHGTHVASTVAGSGVASDGAYRGVAPGADLLNAKVLDDSGFGAESGVIAGLEWAVAQGADVVNLSLGSQPTDGTDPLSLAVDTLSAETGVLVVAAAGNFGYGEPFTVDSPASASAALAVGAVDDEDQLADFSGLGPRTGDHAVKPEITAPGVGIVAAEATGVDLGTESPEGYAELSGTSMATPHVAGAAALLAQQHPDWTGEALKSALVTSAEPTDGLGPFDQGGGRVTVPASLEQTVHTDVATVSLGQVAYPHDDGETATVTVTYTNSGDADITLDLATTVTDGDGHDAAEDLLDVSESALDLPAGESRTVDVTLTPGSSTTPGLYSGYLEASIDGETATVPRLPVGFGVEPESYDVTFDARTLDGEAFTDEYATISLFRVDDPSSVDFIMPGSDDLTQRLRAGTYSANLQAYVEAGDELSLVSVDRPEFVVDGPATVVLDGSTAREVTVDLGDPAATMDSVALTTFRSGASDDAGFATTASASWVGTMRAFATPTDAVRHGTFEFNSQWSAGSPERVYELMFPEPDAVPDDLGYALSDEDTATVHADYHADVDGHTYLSSRFAFRPWSVFAFASTVGLAAPQSRDEVLSAGDTSWAQSLEPSADTFGAALFGDPVTYDAGQESAESWMARPVRPEAGPGSVIATAAALEVDIAEFADPQGHAGFALTADGDEPSVDEVSLRVHRDGELIGDATAAYGRFPIDAGEAEYTLELDVERTADWWRLSPATSTTWTFGAERYTGDPNAGEPYDPVALLQVDYGVELDLLNTAAHGAAVEFAVSHASGAADAAITDVEAWSSTDAGASWTPIDLAGDVDDGFTGVPRTGDGAAGVSLRVAAGDADGRSVEQTITDAYAVAAVEPPEPTPTPSPTVEPTETPGPTPSEPTLPDGEELPDTGTDVGMPGWLVAAFALTGAGAVWQARRPVR